VGDLGGRPNAFLCHARTVDHRDGMSSESPTGDRAREHRGRRYHRYCADDFIARDAIQSAHDR
jgi:hypothetical protein